MQNFMDTHLIWRRLLPTTLVIVFTVYLIQGLSPLRINSDSAIYLHMARSAWLGNGFTVLGGHVHLPSGYPAILTLLHAIGLATPFVFVSLNSIFLLSGSLVFYHLFRRTYGLNKIEGLCLVLMTFFCFVSLKNTVLTMSDTMYYFVSSLALFGLCSIKGRFLECLGTAVLSLILISEAIWVRTVGIALIPPVIFAVLTSNGQFNVKKFIKNKKALGFCFVLTLVVVVIAYSFRGYTSYENITFDLFMKSVAETNLSEALITHFTWKVSEIYQILLNIPISILPDWLKVPFLGAGLLLLCLVARGFSLYLSKICCLDVYFISYSSIIMAWHYQDPRFWLPVLPFLLLFLYRGLSITSYMAIYKFGLISWLTIYGGMGFIALVYSTHLTFSGADFSNRYGGGVYKDMYRSAFSGKEYVNQSKDMRLKFELLKLYEPRAQTND